LLFGVICCFALYGCDNDGGEPPVSEQKTDGESEAASEQSAARVVRQTEAVGPAYVCPVPDLLFGETYDLSAVSAYDFSELTVSENFVKIRDSKTFALYSSIDVEKGVYMAGTFAEWGVNGFFMAMRGDDLAFSLYSDEQNVLMYSSGGVSVIYEPSDMTAIRVDMSAADIWAVIPTTEISQILDDEGFTDAFTGFGNPGEYDLDREISVFDVEIGGVEYVYEYADGVGNLFDRCGHIARIIMPGVDITLYSYTSVIPENAFDEPEGYEFLDFTDLLS
jgi:hypothetical protein